MHCPLVRPGQRAQRPHLYGRKPGGQAQACVITVGHDDAAHHARAETPAGLVHQALPPLVIQECRAEGPCKVGAQVVGSARLHMAYVGMSCWQAGTELEAEQ